MSPPDRSPSQARAVLLDAGGTLFFERPTRYEVYGAAARDRGVDVSDVEMKTRMREALEALPREFEGSFRFTEPWFRAFIELVFGALRFRGNWEELSRHLLDTFRDGPIYHPFSDTRAAMSNISGMGIPIAVVSNWGPPLPAILGRLGLGRYVDVIVTSAVVRMEKPEPAIFHRAAAALRVPIDACLHVGDRLDNDLDGARTAGADARLIDREGRRPDHPDRIASLAEISALVAR